MLNITLHNRVDKKIDEELILNSVKDVFVKNGFTENVEASVAVVHHDEVVRLAVLYMKETEEEAKEHPVLSFLNSELEHEFVFPPDGIKHMGEIIVSYDEAIRESEAQGKDPNEIMAYWAEHGALHLMEIHHD